MHLRLHCSVSIATHQIAEWGTCANQLTPRVLHFSALVCSCRRYVGLCYGCLFIIILEGVFEFRNLGTTAMFLPTEDDSFSAPITVPGSIPAFGEEYSTLYVSINPQHLHTHLVCMLWRSDF